MHQLFSVFHKRPPHTASADANAMPIQSSTTVHASYPSEKLTVGAGVAIFHLATARVAVCYHTRDDYWFLPKGRKNANESITAAAEREGFEESGYRNRLLPLPFKHRATDPDEGHEEFVTEALWTQFLPLSRTSQYLLFWFAAETVPEEVEKGYSMGRAADEGGPAGGRSIYRSPSEFPKDLTLQQRMDLERRDGSQSVYEPIRHPNTGVDEEELLYESRLLPISEALQKLKGSVMEDVVRRGWEAIERRIDMERSAGEQTSMTG